MGLRTLLARRLREHPAALVTVSTTVLLSLLVLGILQVFAAVIANWSLQGTLDNAPFADRTISINSTLSPGQLDQLRAAVKKGAHGLPGATISEVSTAISLGLEGGAESDRIQLADLPAAPTATTLLDGAWPVAGKPIQIAVHEVAAAKLHWQVGTTARLTTLVTDNAKPLDVVVTGIYRPKNLTDAVWLDAPVGVTGVAVSDFTAYGPMVVAPNSFNGDLGNSASAYFRVQIGPERLSVEQLPALRRHVDQTLELLRDTTSRSNAQVASKLPTVLTTAADVGRRTTMALLTPTILLLLLGGAALALATLQLAGLRDDETRLLRSRGASERQLWLLSGVEAGLLVGGCTLGAGLLSPLAARPLAAITGLDISALRYGAAVTSPMLWTPLLFTAALAFAVVLIASNRVGRLRPDRAGVGRGRLGGTLASSGLDIGILLLAAVGVLQLRHYATASEPKLDLMTLTAPALVIGGLAVLALRLIPILARLGSRLVARTSGMPLAWGGWQVARRLGGQSGAILLVLLAMPMGALAIAHSATMSRALVDQSAFEAGAPLRVTVGGGSMGPTIGGRLERITGAEGTPVVRASAEIGTVKGATMLALDAKRAAGLPSPRADLLSGKNWPALLSPLEIDSSDAGIRLDGAPREMSGRVSASGKKRGLTGVVEVVIQDGAGVWTRRPVGQTTTGDRDPLQFHLSFGADGAPEIYPLRIIGFTLVIPPNAYAAAWDEHVDVVRSIVIKASDVLVDGSPVEMPDVWRPVMDNDTTMTAVDLWNRPPALPVLITRDLAAAAEMPKDGRLNVSLPSGPITVQVTGIIEALPTAVNPRLGLVADLASLQALQTIGSASEIERLVVLIPLEWWMSPRYPAAAAQALDTTPGLIVDVVRSEQLRESRHAGSVNAGMRGAMTLLTASAMILAALGFASATAALGASRRHDSAILAAMGMPTGTIRRVLVLERFVVVVLTAIPGVTFGAVAAHLVVPLLVGGDGHTQMPPVLFEQNPLGLALLTLGVIATLTLVAALVVGRSNKDLIRTLRAGDRE